MDFMGTCLARVTCAALQTACSDTRRVRYTPASADRSSPPAYLNPLLPARNVPPGVAGPVYEDGLRNVPGDDLGEVHDLTEAGGRSDARE